jgi:hypothetical protein
VTIRRATPDRVVLADGAPYAECDGCGKRVEVEYDHAAHPWDWTLVVLAPRPSPGTSARVDGLCSPECLAAYASARLDHAA